MTERLLLSDERVRALTDWFDGRGVVTPSVNYAVFDRHGVIFQHGLGEFDRDGRAPELDTIYRICSMSKSFTAACVLALRDQGQLSLDDPVSLHVPEFGDHVDTAGHKTVVTIEMLLSNSSGLPEDNAWTDYHLDLSRTDLVELLRRGFSYSSPPDTEFQYANIGFVLLGLIVERVSGQDFSSFLGQTLLEPLGLSGTRDEWRGYPEGGISGAGIALGFESFDAGATWIHRPFVDTGAFASAGALFSTLPDMAKWCGWLAGGFDETDVDGGVLSKDSRRSMQRIRTPIHGFDRAEATQIGNVGYGFGLVVEHDERFGAIAQHSGGLPGFSCNMRWHCASGIGVVVFANTNSLKAGRWAADMLRGVLVDHDMPAKAVRLWPVTRDAAEAVDRMVSGSRWTDDVDRYFSPNVLADVPAAVRSSRLDAAVREVGGLADTQPPLGARLSWSVSAAQLCWQVVGVKGTIECRIEMTSSEPSVVQRLDIDVLAEDSVGPGNVTGFYVPMLPDEAPREFFR